VRGRQKCGASVVSNRVISLIRSLVSAAPGSNFCEYGVERMRQAVEIDRLD
jgi:hypothetical protein